MENDEDKKAFYRNARTSFGMHQKIGPKLVIGNISNS